MKPEEKKELLRLAKLKAAQDKLVESRILAEIQKPGAYIVDVEEAAHYRVIASDDKTVLVDFWVTCDSELKIKSSLTINGEALNVGDYDSGKVGAFFDEQIRHHRRFQSRIEGYITDKSNHIEVELQGGNMSVTVRSPDKSQVLLVMDKKIVKGGGAKCQLILDGKKVQVDTTALYYILDTLVQRYREDTIESFNAWIGSEIVAPKVDASVLGKGRE